MKRRTMTPAEAASQLKIYVAILRTLAKDMKLNGFIDEAARIQMAAKSIQTEASLDERGSKSTTGVREAA